MILNLKLASFLICSSSFYCTLTSIALLICSSLKVLSFCSRHKSGVGHQVRVLGSPFHSNSFFTPSFLSLSHLTTSTPSLSPSASSFPPFFIAVLSLHRRILHVLGIDHLFLLVLVGFSLVLSPWLFIALRDHNHPSVLPSTP